MVFHPQQDHKTIRIRGQDRMDENKFIRIRIQGQNHADESTADHAVQYNTMQIKTIPYGSRQYDAGDKRDNIMRIRRNNPDEKQDRVDEDDTVRMKANQRGCGQVRANENYREKCRTGCPVGAVVGTRHGFGTRAGQYVSLVGRHHIGQVDTHASAPPKETDAKKTSKMPLVISDEQRVDRPMAQ
ncbi:hypothetical protein DPMN_095998 [Dreissena polymorpha]|uniref:Uncharacterized protein n=1 Tax=Dreissena polymorpha TaxID=45954 RepID=A0A9D4L940_DREPO|nr:hypothetical protein DPMN_095998 [Dreissena polymorpha]